MAIWKVLSLVSNKTDVCLYVYIFFTWKWISLLSLPSGLPRKGILKLLWSLELLICTMKDVSSTLDNFLIQLFIKNRIVNPSFNYASWLVKDQIKSWPIKSVYKYCKQLPSFSPLALLSDEGRADVCGRKASHFFSMAESLRSPTADPFIWVFIRPPWSPTGSCCKAVVFDRLKAECDNNVVGFCQFGWHSHAFFQSILVN